MRISHLISLLEELPGELEIYIAVLDRDSDATGRIIIEPVCESCTDDTVIGYMITDQPVDEVH